MLLALELHLPAARTLKEKRAVVQPLLVGARQRFSVAAAEVGHQDLHQRASLAMVAVGASAGHVEEVIDHVERWVWGREELEVVSCDRTWLNTEA
ncbi:MAG: DUF503 domain-containing protein [Acidimicrobiales bacterium]